MICYLQGGEGGVLNQSAETLVETVINLSSLF